MTNHWLFEALEKYPIRGKSVAVIGSNKPWYESVCLYYGGKCTTIEYNRIISKHPDVKTMIPREYDERPTLFESAFSISSFEHDGLGRYGDPLNPRGDLDAMKKTKQMLEPGGHLFLAVPIGQDRLYWNAYRVYGRLRLPFLLAGWKVLDTFGFEERLLDEKKNRYEPIFVLENIPEPSIPRTPRIGEGRTRVLLYHRANKGERRIIEALNEGIQRSGDHVDMDILSKITFHPLQVKGYDVVFTTRIASSTYVMKSCTEHGVHYVYFDKGYINRGWDASEDREAYYRFSLDSFQPLPYFQAIPRPPDRWEKLNVKLHPRRENGEYIIYAGCSEKFARWYHFEPTEHATRVIHEIKALTSRPIIYRPKPSYGRAVPIPGSVYSKGRCKIEEELENAYALVTFSSNAALDAILYGVPAVVLGPGIARPVSNTDLSMINHLSFPTDQERFQWCCDLAYCQWQLKEIRDGTLWQELKNSLAQTKITPSVPGREMATTAA